MMRDHKDKREQGEHSAQWRDEESGIVYRLNTFSYSPENEHIFGEIVLEYPMAEGPTIRLAQSKSSGEPLFAEFDPANSDDTLPASLPLHFHGEAYEGVMQDLRNVAYRLIKIAREHKCIPCQEVRAMR